MGTPTETPTLLVGISNPATADQLLRLSSVLAPLGPWDILLTHVVTVASQISLTTGQSSPDVLRARDFLLSVRENAESVGVQVRALVEVARSVDEGLLAAAESHGAAMILVGYSDKGPEFTEEAENRFDRTMHRVARKSRSDMIVAKFRTESMERILVPITAGAPLLVTGTLCRAFAAAGHASLTFLHVMDPAQAMEDVRKKLLRLLERRGLGSLGRLDVVASSTPLEAIADKAAQYDMMIVGPPDRPRLMDAIFSTKAQKIAEEAPISVLLAWNRS